MKFPAMILAALSGLLTSLPSFGAEALVSREIIIDGYPYHALLKPSAGMAGALGDHVPLVRGNHYQGTLIEARDSWVRLSEVDGKWQGLVFLNGQVQVVGAATAELHSKSIDGALGETPATCGVAGHDHSIASRSALALPEVSELNYDEFCSAEVGGLCMMSELEMVFDNAFQQRYPDTYQDQALSILNMLEGYYINALKIGFDTLTLEFPSQELFTSSTDSGLFLDAIQANKDSLDFLQNDQSLLHVVTGRDFDGSTVGIAYVGVLCSTFDFNVGTTQIVGDDMALTALTAAHELGHNFGSNHDGDGNTCGGGFVMSPVLDELAFNQGFSSCSIDQMQDTINNLTAPQSCFNFPIDATITADNANPGIVMQGQPFALNYSITLNHAYLEADSLTVTGSLNTEDGELTGAQLDGADCSLTPNQGYQCTLATPTSPLTLTVNAIGNSTRARFEHQVTTQQNTGDLKEILTDDNSLTTEVTVSATDQPGDLQASLNGTQVQLSWTDLADSETGYAVRRRVEGSSTWTLLTDQLPADSTAYTDTTAELGVRYQYQVRTLPAVNDTLGSNITTLLIELPPAARSDFHAEGLEEQVNLSWTDTDSLETGLRLERQRTGTDSWQTIATLDANTTSHQDTTAVLGETYLYRLIAFNESLDSPASLSQETGLIVSAPSDLTVTRQQGAAELRWEDNSATETFYRLERSFEGAPWLSLAVLGADSNFYRDSTITLNRTYLYRVIALSGSTISDPSNTARLEAGSTSSDSSTSDTGTDTTDAPSRLGSGNQAGSLSLWWAVPLLTLLIRRTGRPRKTTPKAS